MRKAVPVVVVVGVTDAVVVLEPATVVGVSVVESFTTIVLNISGLCTQIEKTCTQYCMEFEWNKRLLYNMNIDDCTNLSKGSV